MRSVAMMSFYFFVVFGIGGAVKWVPAAYRVRRKYDMHESHSSLRWNQIMKALGLGAHEDLKKVDSVPTAQGTIVLRLRQRHRKRQIRDSQLDVSMKADGTIDRVGGWVTQDLEESLENENLKKCVLSRRIAILLALAHEGVRLNEVVVEKTKFTKSYMIDGNSSYGTVAIDITWTTRDMPLLTRKIFTIDACTEKVIDIENHQTQIYIPDITNTLPNATETPDQTHDQKPSNHTENGHQTLAGSREQANYEACENHVMGIGGNVKTKETIYGVKPHCLDPIRIENGTCYLENDFIKIFNVNNTFKVDILTEIKFPCQSGFSDPSNGGFSAALDTFFNSIQTIRMFSDWYKFTPFERIKPRAFVHFGKNVDNAFWDGQTLIVGDGGLDTFPYSTMDTVAHEMSHGVTEMCSGLRFRGQSGAINDAFSDMAGEATEFYYKGSNDWVVGAEVVKADGKGIRYFSNPEQDGTSISHVSKYKKKTKVHRASGIFNKAFYLASQILGIRKTFQAFLTANRIYWRERVKFEEAACNVVKAAYDTGLPMEVFQNAFEDVGIMFVSCIDFTEFILPLITNETRDNLIVSNTTHPLFRFEPDSDATRVEIFCAGGKNIKLHVMSSYKRSEEFVLLQGNSTFRFELPLDEMTFLRISSDDIEDQRVSMTILFF